MKRNKFLEGMFTDTRETNVTRSRANENLNASSVKCRKSVFEANAKLADQIRMTDLFGIFSLDKVLVSKATSEVSNVPSPTRVIKNLRRFSARDNVFVECVGNQFADCMKDLPVFQNLVDV